MGILSALAGAVLLAGAAGAFTPGNLVLLVQSYNGKWGPPKGRIEEGETALECALRETREETGLSVNRYIGAHKLMNSRWDMYDIVLAAKLDTKPLSDEITGIGWFTVECMLYNKSILNHPAKLCLNEFMGIKC